MDRQCRTSPYLARYHPHSAKELKQRARHATCDQHAMPHCQCECKEGKQGTNTFCLLAVVVVIAGVPVLWRDQTRLFFAPSQKAEPRCDWRESFIGEMRDASRARVPSSRGQPADARILCAMSDAMRCAVAASQEDPKKPSSHTKKPEDRLAR